MNPMSKSADHANTKSKDTFSPATQEKENGATSVNQRYDPVFHWVLGIATTAILYSILLSRFEANSQLAAAIAATATALAALSVALHSKMRTYSFATWVIGIVTVGILYPKPFLELGPIKGVAMLSYLIQIAMFGMGATLTFGDFARTLRMPKPVAVGFVLQFSCMPILGWSLSTLLRLPPEIALGVILVGSCPGGVSSNVITYLAKGNVALSVTMTACSTLAAPIMTPLMMYLLAGESIPVDHVGMMKSIFMTVFVPVIAGLVFNAFLTRNQWATARTEGYLTTLSIIAICIVCGIIAANSSNEIRNAGAALLLAVLLHNNIGYVLGYWGSKFAGCNEADSRTIAIEVGLQNGGMAAFLATTVIQKSSAAVAPALFGPLMNVTGSLLAAWWSKNSNAIDSEARRASK